MSGPTLDPAFDRDTFLLRQKHLAISEKYYVWDDHGETILYMERPAHLARNALAVLGGVVAAGIFVVVAVPLVDAMPRGPVQDTFAVLTFLGFIVVAVAAGLALSKKRHLTIYRDDTKHHRLLEILQDRKFQPIVATYTVRAPDRAPLAARG